MPVTELAILPLSPSVDLSDEAFLAKLRKTKQIMENALGIPGRRFIYYQGIEDDRVLYLLGDWNSPVEHLQEFIPSAENQEQLAMLKDDFDISHIKMFHIDVPAREVPSDAELISIGRHKVQAENKGAFEDRYRECKPWLDRYISRERKSAGGWRIEKGDEEKEGEWVLFCGWESLDEHMDFAGTEGFEQYARIREYIKGFEVKHGKRIAL